MINNNEGYIKAYRSLQNKAYYKKDSEKVHLWIHLLFKATHTSREEMFGGKPILCMPGQFTTGRKQLSEETGINESKIERILTYFEKTEQQIEQRKSNVNRLISIVNWDAHQRSEQQIGQQVNNDRTTSEQQVNTLQEYKELKKEKEENNTLVESNDSTNENKDDFPFENAWNLYEKKGNKKTSECRWNNLAKYKKELALTNIPLYVQATPDKQYRKNFEAYINQEVWNDEIVIKKSKEQSDEEFVDNPLKSRQESRLHPALRNDTQNQGP